MAINQTPTAFNLAQADATTNAAPSGVVPTTSSPVVIDWGDWASQLINHEAAVVEKLADAGIGAALSAVPFGSVVSTFVAPQVVDQYVGQAVTALSGLVKGQSLTIPTNNAIESTVANLISTELPGFAKMLGPDLDSLIKAGVAKLGL